MTPPSPAYLRGAGSTPVGRHEGRGALDLRAGAAHQALARAGLARADIDGVLCGYATTLPHQMLSTLFCERFALAPRYAHSMGRELLHVDGLGWLGAAPECAIRVGRVVRSDGSVMPCSATEARLMGVANWTVEQGKRITLEIERG